MVFHGFPRLSQSFAILCGWIQWEKKRKHKCDENVFLTFTQHQFYKSKIMLNPTPEPPPQSFMDVLKRWIQNTNQDVMTIKAILVNTHYKYSALTTMNNIKAIVDGDISMSKLPMDNVTSTIAFLLTVYSLVGKLITWKGLYWECLFTSLFNYKVNFQDYLSLWLGCIFVHVFDHQLIPIFVQISHWSLANTR